MSVRRMSVRDEEDQEDREDQEEQEEQEEQDQEDGYAHTPEDRDLPIGRVRAPLVSDVKRINERAFAIVEWYRLPAGVSLTEDRARFERWPGIINKRYICITISTWQSNTATFCYHLFSNVRIDTTF